MWINNLKLGICEKLLNKKKNRTMMILFLLRKLGGQMVTPCLHITSVQLGHNRSSFTFPCVSTFYQAVQCVPLLIYLHMFKLALPSSPFLCPFYFICMLNFAVIMLAAVSLHGFIVSFLVLCNKLFIDYTLKINGICVFLGGGVVFKSLHWAIRGWS